MPRRCRFLGRRIAARWSVGIAAGAFAAASPASAQLIGVARGQGEIGATLDAQRYGYQEGPAAAGRDYLTWIQLPIEGTLWSDRVLSYRLSLRPAWLWQTRSALPDAPRSRHLDASFGATALAAQPVSLSLVAGRTTGRTDGGFGGSRDFTSSRRGATLRARLPGLPVQASDEIHASDETWRSGGAPPLNVASRSRSTRFSAANSKLVVEFQRLTFDDLLRDADYRSWSGQGHHTLRWGRGSRLESGYHAANQFGVFEYRRRDWSERLHLVHSRPLQTDHFYRQSTSSVGGAASRGRAFGTGADLRLTSWLRAGASWSRHAARRDGARDRVDLLAPRLGVALRLPAGFRLAGNGSAGFEWRRRVGSGEFGPVIGESHDIPPSRAVTLDLPDVQPGSVVVRSPDGSVTYLEGPDYELVPAGRSLVLRVPPGSRIAVGSEVAVSYQYRLPAMPDGDALRLDYGVSLERPGFSVRHRRSRRASQEVPAALAPDRADFDERQSALRFQVPTSAGRLEIDAERRERDRADESSVEHELSARHTLPRLVSLDVTLGAAWSRAQAADRSAEGLSLRADATWNPVASLRVHGHTEVFRWSQTESPRQRAATGGVAVDWRLAGMDLAARYDHYRLDYLAGRTTQRLTLSVVRRF